MAYAKINESFVHTADANSDLSAATNVNLLMNLTDAGKAKIAGTDEVVVGVILEAAVADKPVTYQFGGIAKVIAGGTVRAGQKVKSNSAGKAVEGATNSFGIALVQGVANTVISVQLT